MAKEFKEPRNPDGTLKKGSCINPAGRPVKPINHFLKEFALKNMPEMTEIALRMIRDDEMKPGARVTLMIDLWNRAYGKTPTEMIVTNVETSPLRMSRNELLAKVDELEEELKGE